MESAQAEYSCYGYLLSLTQLYFTSVYLEPGRVGSSGNACVSETRVFVFPGSVFFKVFFKGSVFFFLTKALGNI